MRGNLHTIYKKFKSRIIKTNIPTGIITTKPIYISKLGPKENNETYGIIKILYIFWKILLLILYFFVVLLRKIEWMT